MSEGRYVTLEAMIAAAEERGRNEMRQLMRPVGDYDKLAHEAWNVWDLDHLMANEPNEITAAKITARVAAAIRNGEERGRRRGVEERLDNGATALAAELRAVMERK